MSSVSSTGAFCRRRDCDVAAPAAETANVSETELSTSFLSAILAEILGFNRENYGFNDAVYAAMAIMSSFESFSTTFFISAAALLLFAPT